MVRWGSSIVAVTTVLALGAATAQATSSTGNQNPAFKVTASLTPTRAHAGDVVRGVATVTNVSSRSLRVTFEADFSGPASGEAAAMGGRLGPGESYELHFRSRVTDRSPKGRFDLVVTATNRAGTSKASAHATSS
jgi:uncharacterized protein (DUF58 family)